MLNFRDEKLTFEETPLGLVLKGEEISSSLTDLGQSVLDPPDLSLVPETVLSDQLQLLIETGLLERTTWGRVDLRVVGRDAVVHHRERPKSINTVITKCRNKFEQIFSVFQNEIRIDEG